MLTVCCMQKICRFLHKKFVLSRFKPCAQQTCIWLYAVCICISVSHANGCSRNYAYSVHAIWGSMQKIFVCLGRISQHVQTICFQNLHTLSTDFKLRELRRMRTYSCMLLYKIQAMSYIKHMHKEKSKQILIFF